VSAALTCLGALCARRRYVVLTLGLLVVAAVVAGVVVIGEGAVRAV
jgi:hypothetical protein